LPEVPKASEGIKGTQTSLTGNAARTLNVYVSVDGACLARPDARAELTGQATKDLRPSNLWSTHRLDGGDAMLSAVDKDRGLKISPSSQQQE
jgi:hypothetical protein